MPDKLKLTFATRLRELRSLHHLTQEAFAERTGIHRTYIGGIERGKRNVTLATVERVADAFGLDPHDLLRPAE